MHTRFLPLLVLSLLGSISAQSHKTQPAVQSPHDPIRVTSLNNGQFRFTMGRFSRVYALNSSISGCTGTLYDGGTGEKYGGNVGVRVLDEVKKGQHWFVVLQIHTGPNCNFQSFCGAGSNVDVIWLKFSPQLAALGRQAVNVVNCFDNTELMEFTGTNDGYGQFELHLHSGVLALTAERVDDMAKLRHVNTVRYDRRSPERGLNVTQSKIAMK